VVVNNAVGSGRVFCRRARGMVRWGWDASLGGVGVWELGVGGWGWLDAWDGVLARGEPGSLSQARRTTQMTISLSLCSLCSLSLNQLKKESLSRCLVLRTRSQISLGLALERRGDARHSGMASLAVVGGWVGGVGGCSPRRAVPHLNQPPPNKPNNDGDLSSHAIYFGGVGARRGSLSLSPVVGVVCAGEEERVGLRRVRWRDGVA